MFSFSASTATAHLELAHEWRNLLLERLVCDLAAAQVNLVSNKDNGDLDVSFQLIHSAHIDALLAEQRQPVLGHTVKAGRLGD